MSTHPCLKKRTTVISTPTVASYRLIPTLPRKGHKWADEVRVMLPNGIAMTQQPSLPRLPGQVGFRGDLPVSLEDIHHAAEEEHLPVPPFDGGVIVDVADLISPSKYCGKRQRQWECWTTEILPLILSPYLEFQPKTRSLRGEVLLDIKRDCCDCCHNSRKLTIWVICFTSKSTQIANSQLFLIPACT